MTHEISVLLDELHECESERGHLQARVAHYKKRSEDLCDALVSHIEWESEQPQMKAWLLRQKAEAVDVVNRRITTCSEETSVHMNPKLVIQYAASIAGDEAQRLRQAADEAEKE